MKRFAAGLAVLVALGAVPAALASGGLSGKYKQTVKHYSALKGALNGTWTITFSHGAYHVTDNDAAVVHGKYTISANKVTLKDTGGAGACAGTGQYKLKRSGGKLKFTVISDPSPTCVGRKDLLTHGSWTKA